MVPFSSVLPFMNYFRKKKKTWERHSLCISGCPGANFVDQTGLELGFLDSQSSSRLRTEIMQCSTGS